MDRETSISMSVMNQKEQLGPNFIPGLCLLKWVFVLIYPKVSDS